MHAKFTALTPDLYEYLLAHNPPQDDALHALAEETAALGPISMMQIAVEQGAFLTFLAGIMAEGRLYDLCVRLRRTNILLTEQRPERHDD